MRQLVQMRELGLVGGGRLRRRRGHGDDRRVVAGADLPDMQIGYGFPVMVSPPPSMAARISPGSSSRSGT